MGIGIGACLEGKPCILQLNLQLVWFSKEKGFSFYCQKQPAWSHLFVIRYPTFFFSMTQSIPTRPLPQVPTLAGCFGNLCHSCDPVLKAHFWFEFCIFIVKNIRLYMLSCKYSLPSKQSLHRFIFYNIC